MTNDRHALRDALAGGLAGALTLTAIHETARRALPDAPRMDTLGRRALARGIRAAGAEPPRGDRLQALALAGDVVSNTAYYALVGAGRPETALARGAALGAAAGLGAIVLPPLLGLGRAPRGLTARTKAMTFTWYLAGGVAAALAFRNIAADGRR
jgi:hypothetical protein